MNKYKLVNRKTNEETLCDRVTIDGFDYYVNNDKIENEYYYNTTLNNILHRNSSHIDWLSSRKIIATNDPNIDIPKVVDEVEELAKKEHYDGSIEGGYLVGGFVNGYNKSQETHPFSENDMIEFVEWKDRFIQELNYHGIRSTQELLQLWKEQRVITIYYEQ